MNAALDIASVIATVLVLVYCVRQISKDNEKAKLRETNAEYKELCEKYWRS